jgi:hypothetical protein
MKWHALVHSGPIVCVTYFQTSHPTVYHLSRRNATGIVHTILSVADENNSIASDPISMPSLGMNAGQSATKPSMSMKALFLVDRQSTEFDGLTFPLKLHIMLEEAQTLGFEDIIAWNSDGNGLQIHNVEAFTNSVMPQYFQQSQFKSFQRQ